RVPRAAQRDVYEEGGHDGDAGPHGLLPAVDEGLLRGVDEARGVGAGGGGDLDGVGDALAGGVGGFLGDAGQLAVDGAAVAAGDEGAEESNAQRGAEFAGDVVESRGDALLGTGQGAGDGLGGRGHRQAHADAHGEHAGQEGEVAAVHGDEQRHQGEAEGGQGDAGAHGGAGAGCGGHPGGQAGGDHHHDGHGHHRQGGQETRPAEDRLEEREEDDGDAGLDAEDDQQGEGAAGQSALAEEAYVEQGGVAAAQFPPDEHGGGDHSDREAGQGDGVAPAALGAFLQYEDQPDDCEGGEQRPDGVEGVGGMVARVGDRPERHVQGDGGQGDRQHEQPPPVGDVHEQCGEEHAEDAASAGDAGPHTDGLAALLLGEGGGDDGEGDRHD